MRIISHGPRFTQATATMLAIVMGTAVMGATFAAFAQSAAQSAGEQPAMTAESLSQDQLESFVAAAQRVSEIGGDLESQAQGVQDEAELARQQEEANQQMVAAVQEEGLTVDEYNRIFQMAQVDPELNATLREMMTQ